MTSFETIDVNSLLSVRDKLALYSNGTGFGNIRDDFNYRVAVVWQELVKILHVYS